MTPTVEAALACVLTGKAVPAPKKSGALSGRRSKEGQRRRVKRSSSAFSR
ncbi:MAG: hypothetical protein ACLVL7_01985 [Anaerotruncus massiliensis (ex Togo et al. 2019)]